MFHFSLLGETKRWLKFETSNLITSWDGLARKFLIQLFPLGKTTKLRSKILSFKKKSKEILYQAWDRFKSLLSCPHHHQANKVLAHSFTAGWEPKTTILLNSVARGQALEKTYDEFYAPLNCISQGNSEWNGVSSRRVVQKQAGMLEVDAMTAITAQILACRI